MSAANDERKTLSWFVIASAGKSKCAAKPWTEKDDKEQKWIKLCQ